MVQNILAVVVASNLVDTQAVVVDTQDAGVDNPLAVVGNLKLVSMVAGLVPFLPAGIKGDKWYLKCSIKRQRKVTEFMWN